MTRSELAIKFIPVATSILEKVGTHFKAEILGIEEWAYQTTDLPKAIIKLAFRLADEFLEENVD